MWRKLRDLGVAQIGDGLVALPHDARTKEQLEWVAAAVAEAEGEAIVWEATPSSRRDSDHLAAGMRAARAEEYAALAAEIEAESKVSGRTVQRWRRALRRIERRDHLRAPGRDQVRLAIDDRVTDSDLSRNVT